MLKELRQVFADADQMIGGTVQPDLTYQAHADLAALEREVFAILRAADREAIMPQGARR